jgi:hypothetical protein
MLKKIDYTILFTVIIIIAYSLIVIYSATKPAELLSMVDSPVVNQAPLGVFKKQVLNIMLGFVAMAVLLYLHYENLSKHVKFLYVLNLLMLASVLFMGHSAPGETCQPHKHQEKQKLPCIPPSPSLCGQRSTHPPHSGPAFLPGAVSVPENPIQSSLP